MHDFKEDKKYKKRGKSWWYHQQAQLDFTEHLLCTGAVLRAISVLFSFNSPSEGLPRPPRLPLMAPGTPMAATLWPAWIEKHVHTYFHVIFTEPRDVGMHRRRN